MERPPGDDDPQGITRVAEGWAEALERALSSLLRRDAATSLSSRFARALGRLADGLAADRAYVARPQSTGSWSVRADWIWARSSATIPTAPREFKILARWLDAMQHDHTFAASSGSLAAGERTAHNLGTFTAIAFAPIRGGVDLYGALILEHDREPTPWSPAELAALRVLASSCSRMVERLDEPRPRPRAGSRSEPREAPLDMGRRVLDALPAMISWKDAQLIYQGCNRSFARFAGLTTPEQIVGKRDDELDFRGETGDAAARARADERLILEGGAVERRALVHVSLTSAGPTWLEITRVPVYDERGRVLGVAALHDDVTARHEHERLRQRARRLEGLGALAGGLERDLERLLGDINDATLRARDRLRADEAASFHGAAPTLEDLDAIERATRRASALGRQLRDFARRQIVQPTELSLADVVEGLSGQLARVLGDAATLEIEPATLRCLVLGDRQQLERLIVNLVTNARDALERASERAIVRIETLITSLSQERADGLGLAPGEFAVLRVTDTGEGLDPEAADRAFDPYHTTRARPKSDIGAGLSLAVAHGIVAQWGGVLRLTGEPGRGSTAEVYLPRAYRSGEQRASSPAPRGAETIAVMIDSPRLSAAIASLLRGLGYKVLHAASVEHLRAYLLSSEREPVHLVLTDAPRRGNGPELARRIRELLPIARLVFMAGRRELPDAQPSAPGDPVWLIKPFSLEGLAAKIRETLDNR